jgi:hypothetical protein
MGAIRGLSAESIESLTVAVRNGQKSRLDQLIQAIASQNADLSRTLQDMADNYDYDALSDLLREADVVR